MTTVYDQGRAAGLLSPRAIMQSEYDGRTREGKEWWRGFMDGDAERCAAAREPTPEEQERPVVLANGPSDDYAAATPEDPRDITIRTLKEEVERLAGDLETASWRLEGEGQGGRAALLSALSARTILARLAGDAYLKEEKKCESL